MPIATETLKDQYTCDGVTNGPYGITWEFLSNDNNYEVILYDVSEAAEIPLTLTTHYTRSGSNITTVATYASGDKLTIRPSPPFTQTWNPIEGDSFDPDTIAAKLDKLTLISKMLKEEINRMIKAPTSDAAAIGELPVAAERANSTLGFDDSGDPIPVAGSIGTAQVSAYMQTVLDDLNAPAARTTLGLDLSVHHLDSDDLIITDTDLIGTVRVTTGGSDRTVTLPTASANTNRELTFLVVDNAAGDVIVDGESAETINGATTQILYGQYEKMIIRCNGTSWDIVFKSIIVSTSYPTTEGQDGDFWFKREA